MKIEEYKAIRAAMRRNRRRHFPTDYPFYDRPELNGALWMIYFIAAGVSLGFLVAVFT